MAFGNTDLGRLLAKFNMARSDGSALLPPPYNIVAKTTSYTVKPNDLGGTLFTTRGAAGAVTFTLPGPTTVPAGTAFYFANVVDQNMAVTIGSATGVADGNATATSLTASTASHKIGALIQAVSDGTQWFLFGQNVGVTYTVA